MDLEKCFLLYFLLYYGTTTVIDAYLKVVKYPLAGESGSLKCNYNTKLPVTVLWSNSKTDNITLCEYPAGYCSKSTIARYVTEVAERFSLITITSAQYDKDDGKWFCKVNDLTSETMFYVTSIPKTFRFDQVPTPGMFVPQTGLFLNATATCLYPFPDNVRLRYRHKGQEHTVYDIFPRTPTKIPLDSQSFGCSPHEKTMELQIQIEYDDFNGLNIIFRFQYETLSGQSVLTDNIVDLRFSSHPCHPQPCKQGGRCRIINSRQFVCECTNGYTGDTCDDEVTFPTTPSGNTGEGVTFSTTPSGNTGEGDLQAWIIVAVPLVIVLVAIGGVFFVKTQICKGRQQTFSTGQDNDSYTKIENSRNSSIGNLSRFTDSTSL